MDFPIETNLFDNLDFNLEALFLWITFFLAARSSALKTSDNPLADGFFLNCRTAVLNAFLVNKLYSVLRLSCRTFLIACFITGISINITQV